MSIERQRLPMAPLRGLAIVPEMTVHFDVSRERSIAAMQEALSEGKPIFLVMQKDEKVEVPLTADLHSVGCVASVRQIVKMPGNKMRVTVAGQNRGILESITETQPYIEAEVTVVDESDLMISDDLTTEARMRALKETFSEYASRNKDIPKEAAKIVADMTDIRTAVNELCAMIPCTSRHRQELLDEVDFWQRYERLMLLLMNEIHIIGIKDDLQMKVKERIEKNQREYILREQMKLIREELGEDHTVTDAQEFEKAVKKLKAPKEVKEKLRREIGRFKSAQQSPAETGVIRTYIETMLEMPWDKAAKDSDDMAQASRVLHAEHYGLEKVKERILEFLAVRALTKKGRSPILCLVGPPGTGKTSIARSLAKATDKPYVRISLGGVRDEAEIRGHRRTYVGAMPGRIAAGLRSAGVRNPLMLLDEIDKVSTDYKGDTFSALLEVLDPEQNSRFRDHYLELPLDLSEVMFITTANTLSTIPAPLLDRMEVIQISGYTENEKLHIAKEHLVPKQLDKNGLSEEQLTFSDKSLLKIASSYTREAGVRQLEREIGNICRKVAREILENGVKKKHITEKMLTKYLGRIKHRIEPANAEPQVGIVRGLAWTSVGGDTLQIEVNVMPGQGEIMLTGQLGDVMKESARTALSYLRSVGGQYDIKPEFFREHDIHVHIPEGAVPKDGPSAGITMATAILSAITGRKVRSDVAMTGEVTLRGRVLPIGGLKEKLLAAKMAGMRTVLVPEKNSPDVEELSAEITKGMRVIPVETMENVLEHVFADEPVQLT